MPDPSYDLPLWRPPSEGPNLIVQASLGCGYNACSFCGMYRDKTYRERPLDEVLAEIDRRAADWPDATRLFLADGDAYGLPTATLAAICDHARRALPDLQRVSAYATPFNLLRKTADDIALLKEKRLSLVYVGIESGSDRVLKAIAKGSRRQMDAGLRRAAEGGVKISATIITGLSGQDGWEEHIDATADLINAVPPAYLSTLQLGLDARSEPDFLARMPGYRPQDDRGVLVEVRRLIERLDPPRPVIFRTNHASNALPLAGTLPKDRARLSAEIDAALAGSIRLRPASLRGL
jgi:hypothetical protein